MPRALPPEKIIDAWLDHASQATLERLQSDVRAVLRWKYGVGATEIIKRTRKAKDGQLPLTEAVKV